MFHPERKNYSQKKIDQLLNNNLSNIKVKSAEFDFENTFSFKIDNNYKIENLKMNSYLNLKNSKE